MSSPSSQTSEETILNPYNPINKVITNEVIYSILTRFGIKDIELKDIDTQLFIKSLLHKSYTVRSNYELSRCNQDNFSLIQKPDNCLDFFKGDSYEKLNF